MENSSTGLDASLPPWGWSDRAPGWGGLEAKIAIFLLEIEDMSLGIYGASS